MEPQVQPQIPPSRDGLNFEIDIAFARCSKCVRDMMTSGIAHESDFKTAYFGFLREFIALILLTRPLPSMIRHNELVQKSIMWVVEYPDVDNSQVLKTRCESAIRIFMEYSDVMGKEGLLYVPVPTV